MEREYTFRRRKRVIVRTFCCVLAFWGTDVLLNQHIDTAESFTTTPPPTPPTFIYGRNKNTKPLTTKLTIITPFCSKENGNRKESYITTSLLSLNHRNDNDDAVFINKKRHSFVGSWSKKRTIKLYATNGRKKASNKDIDDDVDIPEDWSEDDVLAELGGDEVGVGDGDVDDDDIIIEEDNVVVVGIEGVSSLSSSSLDDGTQQQKRRTTDDDDDEDELDLDEIDLDDDEDDEIDEEEPMLIHQENMGGGEYYVKGGEEWELEPGDGFIPWDPEEDGIDYELQDDPSDPNYTMQKQIVEQAIQASKERMDDINFDAYEFVSTYNFTPEQISKLDNTPLFQEVAEKVRGMQIVATDLEDDIDIEKEYAEVSDLMEDDPYPRHDDDEINILQEGTGLTDDDMEELDKTYKSIKAATSVEPWDQVMTRSWKGYEGLSNETLAEMDECLEELGGSAYNVTNWLLYDLSFNVSNLILAAVKHNPDAPVLFQHWYPQLVTYKRYQHARDRNYDFTWHDVDNADITELERYYAGFGYESIPKKAPSETGIISLEELDEEEIKMAALENWMTDVYNPEGDRKDFDDDELRDEDNVFSDFYEHPQHPDLPAFDDAIDDLNEWKEELGDGPEVNDPDVVKYRNMMGQSFDYQVVQDEEFEREFRGHLVIACTGYDDDLEIAEKITERFQKEFKKQVYVETRIMALARQEDNVFEIWLESYDIDLLHSKKRATSNAKGWDGPAEIDDRQIDYLTDRVRFLISDDARYSYRWEFDLAA